MEIKFWVQWEKAPTKPEEISPRVAGLLLPIIENAGEEGAAIRNLYATVDGGAVPQSKLPRLLSACLGVLDGVPQ